jgi:hypothetical protein
MQRLAPLALDPLSLVKLLEATKLGLGHPDFLADHRELEQCVFTQPGEIAPRARPGSSVAASIGRRVVEQATAIHLASQMLGKRDVALFDLVLLMAQDFGFSLNVNLELADTLVLGRSPCLNVGDRLHDLVEPAQHTDE